MLKDRKVLVEAEITRQTQAAARMYLDIVRGVVTDNEAYSTAREHITDLQHEHKMIQLLLDQGHE